MRISDWSSDVCSSDLLCSKTMSATAFDSDASLDERRVIIRRGGGDVEMVKLPWGLQPREFGGRPFTVLRAEDRTFPSHRCLVPRSEEHTSELQSLMRISYAVFCLKKKRKSKWNTTERPS